MELEAEKKNLKMKNNSHISLQTEFMSTMFFWTFNKRLNSLGSINTHYLIACMRGCMGPWEEVR